MDETVLPAIALAKRESSQDRLTDAEEQQMLDAMLRVLTEALPDVAIPQPEESASRAGAIIPTQTTAAASRPAPAGLAPG